MELTKIPLATAVYYSVRLSWKIVFLIGLLLVNISTFETIVTGFERINRERTKVVDRLIVEYHSIKKQIFNLQANTQVTNIQDQINTKIKERSAINKEIAEINLIASKNKADIQGSSTNQGEVEVLENEIKTITNEIQALRDLNNTLNVSLGEAGFFKQGRIKKQIEANDLQIKSLEESEKS